MSQGGPSHNGSTDDIKSALEADYDECTAELLKRFIDRGELVNRRGARTDYAGAKVSKTKAVPTVAPLAGQIRRRRARGR